MPFLDYRCDDLSVIAATSRTANLELEDPPSSECETPIANAKELSRGLGETCRSDVRESGSSKH